MTRSLASFVDLKACARIFQKTKKVTGFPATVRQTESDEAVPTLSGVCVAEKSL
jgi:hypothetical protein